MLCTYIGASACLGSARAQSDEALSSAHVRQWVGFDGLSLEDRISGYSILLKDCRERMTKKTSKAANR